MAYCRCPPAGKSRPARSATQKTRIHGKTKETCEENPYSGKEERRHCGRAIKRASRTGHLDHVRAASEGGSNSVFNRVLACARCNGDFKRETSWRQFLEETVEDPVLRRKRAARIQAWLDRAPRWTVSPTAEAIIQEALMTFDKSVAKLRTLRTPRT